MKEQRKKNKTTQDPALKNARRIELLEKNHLGIITEIEKNELKIVVFFMFV
ncbi:MAG: hypothetical protein QM526_00385 [Alphaproteobacteria bacterium]|nr:hypothetical protein [Alphaproteobacteria bacterium]